MPHTPPRTLQISTHVILTQPHVACAVIELIFHMRKQIQRLSN